MARHRSFSSFQPTQGDASWNHRSANSLHLLVGRLDLKVEQDGVAVLHQGIGRVAQAGFLAAPFVPAAPRDR